MRLLFTAQVPHGCSQDSGEEGSERRVVKTEAGLRVYCDNIPYWGGVIGRE